MKKLFLAFVMCLFLVGCQSKEICGPTEEVTIEKILSKPDIELMKKEPPKQYLEKGSEKSKVAKVISDNNLRSGRVERRLEGLQRYICNTFKDYPKEICK